MWQSLAITGSFEHGLCLTVLFIESSRMFDSAVVFRGCLYCREEHNNAYVQCCLLLRDKLSHDVTSEKREEIYTLCSQIMIFKAHK